MKKNKTYIIAEVGTNHNGSLKTALKYVDKLATTGVDAVKFQIADFKEVYSDKLFAPDYRKKLNKKVFKGINKVGSNSTCRFKTGN